MPSTLAESAGFVAVSVVVVVVLVSAGFVAASLVVAAPVAEPPSSVLLPVKPPVALAPDVSPVLLVFAELVPEPTLPLVILTSFY
jgi:hypothetical protein